MIKYVNCIKITGHSKSTTELRMPGSPSTKWFFMACVCDVAPVEGVQPQVYVLRRKFRTMEEALEHARIIAVRWNRLLARSMLRVRRN